MQSDPGRDSGGGQRLGCGCSEGKTTGKVVDVDVKKTWNPGLPLRLQPERVRGRMPHGKVGRNVNCGQGNSGCLLGFKGSMHVGCWRGHGGG